MVVGLGGVGSWAAEALARSGVGSLSLVDLDDICVSNVNRQLPALDGAIGRPKAEALAERFQAIHPGGAFTAVLEYFTADNAFRLLEARPDYVVDAIDSVANKSLLAATCRRLGVPNVVCGAAGGRTDPTRLTVRDLSEVTDDRLLREMRKRLRREHGWPREGSMNLPCVISTERALPPAACEGDRGLTDGGARLNCDSGYGSAVFVTGAMGFAAAARVAADLAAGRPPAP